MSIEGPSGSLVGAEILNLITTGMYHSPLAIYREYIQNAADAIQASSGRDTGRVDITVDPGARRITIRDNGPGLTWTEARRELVPIARSRKRRGVDRGFRGVGRLCGLAFADTVTFRTRSCRTQPVTEISWDGMTLRAEAATGADLSVIVHKCVEVLSINQGEWPDHFFEVEVKNVARHASGQILNRETVRGYIGEVCPVPMAKDFPFSNEIGALFGCGERPLALEVFFVGETEPICRRHGAVLKFSDARMDTYVELQPLRIPAADGDGTAAVGWIAHSSYLGAIPRELGVRGLRVREGNIQIGGEDVFDPLFREERFNRWCVGELHVFDPRILSNSRRDYFEPSPHIRHMENQLEAIVQQIVSRCRNASTTRNQMRKVQTKLQHLSSAYELAESGYLKADDARTLIKQMLLDARALEQTLNSKNSDCGESMRELARLKSKLTGFQPRRGCPRMGKIRSRDIEAYQRVFHALTEICSSPSVAKEMIESVLTYA